MPDETQVNPMIAALEERVRQLETRLAEAEHAVASFVAPHLGAVRHDAYGIVLGWLKKFEHIFEPKAAAEPPKDESPSA